MIDYVAYRGPGFCDLSSSELRTITHIPGGICTSIDHHTVYVALGQVPDGVDLLEKFNPEIRVKMSNSPAQRRPPTLTRAA